MKCIKCHENMFNPDIIVDVERQYLSIYKNKIIDMFPSESNIEIMKLQFSRGRYDLNMKAKMSICCLNCGFTVTDGSNIKLQSQNDIELKFKKFSTRRKF